MAKPVASKEQLLDAMFKLLDECDAIQWPSQTSYEFIQHMAEWLAKSSSDSTLPTWDLFAQLLEAGRGFDETSDNA